MFEYWIIIIDFIIRTYIQFIMESLDEVIEKNLERTYLLFSSSQGIPYRRPREETEELIEYKAMNSYKGIPEHVTSFLKRRKTEIIKKTNPSYNPSTSQEHLSELLSSTSSSTTLDIFQNKYLNLKLKSIEPVWHPPWKLMRVISGHQGWVRCLSVDPTNSWFASGSNDRMIKIWDMATGQLKLSLVGHINPVRSIIVSDRHPYLFSCGEDKNIYCWDLEHNKIVRHYHGHLTGVYTLALHPKLDVLISGSRDCVCRVWDIRTKTQVRVLEGHTGTVFSIASQANEPQIVSGSADCTIKLWDLGSGKSIKTLTKHKKSIRAIKFHHEEYTFMSAGADNLKLWKCPDGDFLRHFDGYEGIVNDFAINPENVMATGGDDGTINLWDYNSGYQFQTLKSKVQPGSLSSESGIFATAFDMSGLRLITAECDKTIKIWKEDENASIDTHPIPEKAKIFLRSKY